MRMKFLWMVIGLMLVTSVQGADEASETDYRDRLERYDIKTKPENHKRMASWCKRSYPSKYQHHVTEANRYEFSQSVDNLPSKPGASDYLKLKEKAEKLSLPDETKTYLGKWGELQYAAFAKRLEPGNEKMMKQLLEWSEKNSIAFIAPAQKLAADILTTDPEYALSRKVLGHIRWQDSWMTKADAIKSIKIKSLPDRIALHKAAAEARSLQPIDYPSNPTRGMESRGKYYAFSPQKSPNSRFLLLESGYKRSKPSRLILSLHGGGDGGPEAAANYARITMDSWTRQSGDHIVLAPIATRHVTESWRDRRNVHEIIDAMEEICQRFNIDRKRIYITGHSMGGAGATTFYNAFPEFAAASCGRAGWFYFYKMQEDLLNKPIMIIQGEEDTEKRVDSKKKFLKMAAKHNGNVTNISLDGVGHDIMPGDSFANFLPFFEKHTNDIEPDFDVIRAAADKWMTK